MLLSSGEKARVISEKEGIPLASVYGIASRYRLQKSALSQPRTGRPSKLSDRDKRHIARLIEVNPFISPADLAEEIGGHVVGSTVLRYLQSEGIKHHRALRRPALTPIVAQKRLEFAQKYVNKPDSFWRRWIFLDESTVARGDGERAKWVFCRSVSRALKYSPIFTNT